MADRGQGKGSGASTISQDTDPRFIYDTVHRRASTIHPLPLLRQATIPLAHNDPQSGVADHVLDLLTSEHQRAPIALGRRQPRCARPRADQYGVLIARRPWGGAAPAGAWRP